VKRLLVGGSTMGYKDELDDSTAEKTRGRRA
jgi:hypothetical protein